MVLKTKQSLIESLTKSASNINRIRTEQQALKSVVTSAEPAVIQSDNALAQGLDARVTQT